MIIKEAAITGDLPAEFLADCREMYSCIPRLKVSATGPNWSPAEGQSSERPYFLSNMAEQLRFLGSLAGHKGWVTAIATSSENPDMILTASRGIFPCFSSKN